MLFNLSAPYEPRGDQPEAIRLLTEQMQSGQKHNVLLGVTGSGKTYTMANVIANLGRPTLVMSHNKTLAAQLYSEFKQFFPDNAVEYFVSYFDYYQPEAYIPRTDTYIEKDSSVNEEIERLRLSATSSLMTRRDVVLVASVSCIYGLGSPEDYEQMVVNLKVGQMISRDHLLLQLVEIQYERNDIELARGRIRARGDVVELCPAHTEEGLRIEFFGDEVEALTRFDVLTGETIEQVTQQVIFPARHYVTPHDKIQKAIRSIKQELEERIEQFEKTGKMVEAQRLKMRTTYDLEMMQEMGFCNGIENYSRHLSGRPPGSRPYTLLDFFPEDMVMMLDESHVSVPQIGGMYAGDRSRKQVLVEHGFRLPSALDNRPLQFPEFEEIVDQVLYVSATPGKYEMAQTDGKYVEQIIRPTGLLDPTLVFRPLKGQIDDLIQRARERVERGERVLVTTLTKRTAEDLASYLGDADFKVQYMHSEIDAIERVEILRALRAGEYDVLVGINLLREGLDLPEVSLVAILDADKEGYLRSETSLIQTAGRAARHVNGQVILYADKITGSLQRLKEVTEYRRSKQIAYNKEHGITPQSVKRAVQESLHTIIKGREVEASVLKDSEDLDVTQTLADLEKEMMVAAEKLEFEKAALLRDQINELKKTLGDSDSGSAPSVGSTQPGKKKVSYRSTKGAAKKTAAKKVAKKKGRKS